MAKIVTAGLAAGGGQDIGALAERFFDTNSVRTVGRFWRVSASDRRRLFRFDGQLPAFGGFDRVGRAEDK